MIKIIIGVDIDNCLNSLCESVLSVYNEDVGDNLTVSNIEDYYIEKYVKPENRENFHLYFIDKRVWKRIKLIDNCVNIIREIHNHGHEIYFVTSTEPQNVYKKSRWLQRNFPFLNIRKRLICIHNKKLLQGLDILIDDCLDNLVGGTYRKIVFDYPWNRNIDDAEKGLIRCKNWKEIRETIKSETRKYEVM